MIQRCDRLGFRREPPEPFWIGRDGGVQYLDGDVPVQPWVTGSIDLAHPSRTERSQYFVWADTGTGREAHREASTAVIVMLFYFNSLASNPS